MPKDDLEIRFLQAIGEGEFLSPRSSLVVAVSGGIDSMVLLHLICRLMRGEDWSLTLHVAHLNHRLRGEESDEDARFVAEQSARLGVPCTVESADAAARADETGLSIEAAARQCRMKFLERVCLRTAARTVALGHHADDNVETLLHRLIRGTGIRGLAGIPSKRPIREGSDIRLIRPLLMVRRADIERYAAEQEIPFRHDRTNDSDLHARNRIRHTLLPLLREQFNPQVDDALLRLADQAGGLDAYLSETGSRMLESLVIEHDDRHLVLHSPSLARRPRVIRAQLIRQAIMRMGVGEREVTFGHLNAVADLAAGEQGSKGLHLPGGLRVLRSYGRLIFERSTADVPPADHDCDICVSTNGTTPLPRFGLELRIECLPADDQMISAHIHHCSGREQCSYEEWIDADQVRPPLIARARRPGDRFFPLGMADMKKLSDFFIDEKIDASQRERTVILCDQLGPIWVAPLRIDERVRLTRATRRILRLVARPLGTGSGAG